MRRFVVTAHDVPPAADIALDDLPGAGRLDLIARAAVSAFLLSHDIREDVQLSVVVRDELVVRLDGATLRGLHPDERSTAARLRGAIEAAGDLVGATEIEPSPGVTVRRGDLADVLLQVTADETVVQLHKDGEPVADVAPPTDPVFVLSDHREFTDEEARLLADEADHRLRLGPEALHADDAIAVAHNWLDTDGFTRY